LIKERGATVWYIDSDNVIHIEGLRNAATLVYINDATITAILFELPALQPDAAAVTNETGGKVGIPCAGHTLKDGETVRLERFLNYNGTYTLQAGSTGTDKLIITETYVAETLTGNEFVYRAVYGSEASPITFDYIAGSNGNYVGKMAYTAKLLQGVDYMMCIKEVSASEQVLAKVIYTAGFQGM